MSTLIRDFRKGPTHRSVKDPSIYDVPASVKKRIAIAVAPAGKYVTSEDELFHEKAMDRKYPTTARIVKLRNELNRPIWVLWRDGTVQCLPFLSSPDRSNRVMLTATFSANSWAAQNSVYSVENKLERTYFNLVDNQSNDDSELKNSIFHVKMADQIQANIKYDSYGDMRPGHITAEVCAHVTYEHIAAEANGLYIPEYDVVLSVEDISGRVYHPAIAAIKAGETKPNELLDAYDSNSSYFSIFIADRNGQCSDKQFLKLPYRHMTIPVLRDYAGLDGVYITECTKFDLRSNRKPIINHDYFELTEGIRIFNIKNSLEELLKSEGDIDRKQSIEDRKLDLEEKALDLKNRELAYKTLELKTRTAVDINKLNKEFARESLNQRRADTTNKQQEHREDNRFKRDMLSDSVKMITSILSLVATVIIFAKKSK